MARVTGFGCVDGEGRPVACDAHGNNVAFLCTSCGGPVLAVILENQRGSGPKKPSGCKGCDSRFWVELDGRAGQLIVRQVTDAPPL
jgi:hypothetical protein